MEIERGQCKPLKQAYSHEANDPKYYISSGINGEMASSRYVMQMDTESSIIYQKICLWLQLSKTFKGMSKNSQCTCHTSRACIYIGKWSDTARLIVVRCTHSIWCVQSS